MPLSICTSSSYVSQLNIYDSQRYARVGSTILYAKLNTLYLLNSIIFASSYAVTDRAWRALRDMSTDQCVLISGEAGSGKTESAKLTLQYLAAVTGHAKEFHNIKYQLLQSNSVLEGKQNISKNNFRNFRNMNLYELSENKPYM